MSNVTDLATFQLNAQPSSHAMPTSEIVINPPGSGSGESISRVDSSHHGKANVKRAHQLKEFTDWLAKRNRSTHHAPEKFVSQPLEIEPRPGGPDNSGRVFRVDSTKQPFSELQFQSPHFDTKNYVEATEVVNYRQPLSKQQVPTDGFDPVITSHDVEHQPISATVQELKADGRVLGDSQQSEVNSVANLTVPAFRWPAVSNNLLGSPAMINLENNIRQSLQTYRTQIVVSATRRDAGASTVALSLARQLVENDHSVLLIDADLENPSLAYQLGLTTPMSWTQTIQEGRPTNQLIIKQKNAGLSLLPLTKPETSYAPMEKIYDNLSTISNPLAWIYDFVVIDVGPVAQYLAHSSKAKIRAASTLLVSDCSQPSDTEAHRMHAQLRLLGAENILMVQNFSRVATAARVG